MMGGCGRLAAGRRGCDRAMIILRWVETAPVDRRADATCALARAYLYSSLSADEREAAEAAMTVQLDDPAPFVRMALARALAKSDRAPRSIILALVGDVADVATIILEQSPLLLDGELVDLVATLDDPGPVAIARRPVVSAAVSGAIAEVGSLDACLALIGNPGATIAHFSLTRMVERHGEASALRDALMARPDTPLDVRQMLLKRLGDMLAAHPLVRSGLKGVRADRVVTEARERATVAMASDATPREAEALVEHLRVSEQLTAALLLRAVCAGNIRLFEAAIARLADMTPARVYAMLSDARPTMLRALLSRAGLPERTHNAFVVAIEVWRDLEREGLSPGNPEMSRRMIERILTRYQGFGRDELDDLLGLLRRFATEAAREAARAYVARTLAA